MAVPLEPQSASPLLMGREDGSSVSTVLGGALGKSSPTTAPVSWSFQKDLADGTAVTVPVRHMALSAEEQRNVEAFENGKTKPRSQQLWNLGSACVAGCKWKGKEGWRSCCHHLGRNRIHKVILGEMLGFGEYGLTWCLLMGPSLPLQEQQVPLYQLWGQSCQEGIYLTKGAFPNQEEPPVSQGKLPMCSTVFSTGFVVNINEKTNLAIRKWWKWGEAELHWWAVCQHSCSSGFPNGQQRHVNDTSLKLPLKVSACGPVFYVLFTAACCKYQYKRSVYTIFLWYGVVFCWYKDARWCLCHKIFSSWWATHQ